MVEVRIHGRGGQGNVIAAYLLASAAISEGWHALAFPAFGAERRGAPVVAFVRMSEQHFRRRDHIAAPDFLIVQDDALLHVEGVLSGLKPDGAVLVNSKRDAKDLALGMRCYTIPATQLAREKMGQPVPNTALLSVFLTLTGLLSPEALEAALTKRFTGNILAANQEVVQAAVQGVPRDLWQQKPESEEGHRAAGS